MTRSTIRLESSLNRKTKHVIQWLNQSPTFIKLVTRLVKQDTEIAVASEIKCGDDNIEQKLNDDQNTPPSPLTGGSKNSCRASEDEKKEDNKKPISHSSRKSPCKKCNSNKARLNDDKANRHNKGSSGVTLWDSLLWQSIQRSCSQFTRTRDGDVLLNKFTCASHTDIRWPYFWNEC